MKLKGQLSGVASLLSQYGFWESNSGPQAWCLALLPTVPSHQPISVTVNGTVSLFEIRKDSLSFQTQ